jgi:putative FmdB family regulatory protein
VGPGRGSLLALLTVLRFVLNLRTVPIYEYECTKCGHRFEVVQKLNDAHITRCEKCKGKVERLVSSPAIQFKGTGWYVTDYARKSSGPEPSKSDGATSDAAPKADSKKSKDSQKDKDKSSSSK